METPGASGSEDRRPGSAYNRRAVGWRIVGICALLALQFEIAEIFLRGYFDANNPARDSLWAPLYGYSHYFFSFVLLFPAALLIVTWPRCLRHGSRLLEAATAHHWFPLLTLQLAFYSGLLLLTYALSVYPEIFSGFARLWLLAWAALLIVTALSSLLVLASAEYWRRLFLEEWISFLLAATMAVVAIEFTLWLRTLSPALAIGALHGTHALLSPFYDQLIFDASNQLLGTNRFAVQVSNACAGYEGITLIAIFLTIYLWYFRHRFRFPWVLFAYPIGFTIIWSFNIVRIAAIIVIGDSFSSAVAMAGFHSNAGWIAFLAVSLGMIWLLHKVPLFTKPSALMSYGTSNALVADASNIVDALLVPFVVLLTSILILGAFTADFDLLYPLKVIATGTALWYFRKYYAFYQYRINLEAIAVGALVFVIWLLVVPALPEHSARYVSQFSEWPAFATFGWLAFRVMGSIITVPLAEELAFRGYLLAKLSGKQPAINSPLKINLVAFSISSLLFGLLHGNWVAGTLAGMAYAYMRYRRGRLSDAVIAHMTTNLLLSIYVLLTQQWSYW